MKLFLIRHGETVDNVAQIYAGIKDSSLTVHGSLQADRLGQHFGQNDIKFTRIFSSDLERAYKTAEAIHFAQPGKHGRVKEQLRIEQLPILREQDFGFYEGKPFYARPRGSNRSCKEKHRSQHQDDPDFKDVESKESMNSRVKTFLGDQLLPLFQSDSAESQSIIAVVSHGIILSHLWRCLLKLFKSPYVILAPGVSVSGGVGSSLEHLGGWHNTGYLELDIGVVSPAEVLAASEFVPVAIESSSTTSEPLSPHPPPVTRESQCLSDGSPRPPPMKMVIRAINSRDHLKGLKRTRGGVGSSKYDAGQKTIDTFFKKQKVS